MRIPAKIVFSSFIILLGSGQAWAEGSLRQQLIESGMPSAVYAVDGHTTVFMTGSGEKAGATLKGLCSGSGAAFSSLNGSYACEGVFEASQIDSPAADENAYILKTTDKQPLAYVTHSIPSAEEVGVLPNGRIAGDHASVDIYQYAYALCEKEGGTPSFVVSKRFGRFARYTEVGAEEAFSQLLESGDGKDPWFIACDSENRFMVEKDYGYDPQASSRFYFHQRRGLEGVDYVKAEDGKLARLDAR